MFRLDGPLAAEPVARVLHILLVCILIWVGTSAIIIGPWFPARKLAALALECGWLFTAALARYQLRRGSLRKSAILYVAGTWLVSSFLIVPSGGFRSPFLMLYMALPISAAWLLGRRATLWTAALCIGSCLALALMEAAGLGPYLYFPSRPIAAWAVMVYSFLIASVPVAQIMRALRDSLAQSRLDQEALRKEHELLSTVMDTSPSGILALDRKGQIRFANMRGADVLGATRDELFRRSFDSDEWNITTYDGQPLPHDQLPFIQTRNRREAIYGIPIAIQQDDRRILLSVNTAPLVNAAGEFEGMVTTIEDVTERRRAEEQLRESEERFRTMADNVPAGIVLFNREGLPAYGSKWLLTFLGVKMEQFVGDDWLQVVHPEDVNRLVLETHAAVRERRVSQIEHRLRRHDGEYSWVAATASPRFIHGEFAGRIVLILDITEIKRAQEQSLANQKLEGLGVMAAGIAHDFNNFLGAILGNADLALQEIPEESPARESVTDIATVAGRASVIVKLMLDYAGRGDADLFEAVDLSSLIEEMVRLLRVSVPRSTSLRMNLSGAVPPIWTSAAQLRQVVMNLVINGSEALDAKPGTVTLSTSCVRLGGESSESRPPAIGGGDYVLLEVADTGCGMTEEIKARIFDPFFSTKVLGRGLGLASVQGIIRVMGGAIGVVSAPEEGSRFKIWLPYRDRRSDASVMLVVDDENGLNPAMAPALKREGFYVLEAHDGLVAVQMFAERASEIAAVVLDLTLPGLSNRDVYDEMRRVKADVPVLFISALDPTAESEPGLHTNQRFLQKPCRLEDLIQTLREVVPAAAPTIQATDRS